MVKLTLSTFHSVIYCFLFLFFYSCTEQKAPNVSHIKVQFDVKHFEKDFFTIDTTHTAEAIIKLNQKYPSFTPNFLTGILNADPAWSADTTAWYLKQFIKAYMPVYDSAEIVFANFKQQEEEIKRAFQFLKYYFPSYAAPEHIITYIGPVDGYGDILDEHSAYIGLQHHLGKNYSLYNTPLVQETYPFYISRQFIPATIPINLMKNIILDIYPEQFGDKTLVIQMVEKGKRLFLLQLLLPEVNEYLLIGYSKEQMKDCYAHERAIWDLFIHNNLLQITDYSIIRNYIGEGPKTIELGEASPGNIGSFSGWQIVKQYMKKHSQLTPDELMSISAEKIFNDAKYKP
ncbi:MAG: hypothetical protein KF829_09885 [Ferruginibacter sp.]|nr:hypothetical protein [Ferruginibacter sp.]